MRTVFFGTPDWAVPTLRSLAASPHTPTLVVTQPPKRRGRGGAVTPSPVAREAVRLGLRVHEAEAVRTDAFAELLAAEDPDLFVVVAFGRILPQRLLDLPRLAPVNVHFSLLPRWRGAAPVQWALAEGDEKTGVSTMRMVLQLDAGPVYLAQSLPIEPGEHAPALGARLAEAGARALMATVEGLAGGTLEPRPQQEEGATIARMLRPEDGWIDWNLRAGRIACRVRGFDPWPGQSTRAAKGPIRVLEAREAGYPAAKSPGAPAPGTVLGASGAALHVACVEGTVLEILKVQPEARRPMSGAEALRGRHVAAGERLAQ